VHLLAARRPREHGEPAILRRHERNGVTLVVNELCRGQVTRATQLGGRHDAGFAADHRLGDLRRLSRSTTNDGYGRDPESVFPTGAWFRGGVYGPDTNFPIPIEELNNPNVPGPAPNTCLDRNP